MHMWIFVHPWFYWAKVERFIFLSLLIVRTEINPTVQETSHSSLLSPGIKRVYWNPQMSFILWYQWCLLHYFSQTVRCDQCRQSVRSTGIACLFFILSASIVSTFWLLLSCHFESLMPQIIVCSLYCKASPPTHPLFLPPSDISLHSQEKHHPPLSARCVYISLLFSSLLLACWFNQFYQMTFLAAVKRKPRAG